MYAINLVVTELYRGCITLGNLTSFNLDFDFDIFLARADG